jgi:hypothetical protein
MTAASLDELLSVARSARMRVEWRRDGYRVGIGRVLVAAGRTPADALGALRAAIARQAYVSDPACWGER